ncbi:endoflagellar motor protein [Leptospira perolatii]|uniref:Endoflagellar motor protein n=1 Tax=Leptospira perolatii TaxID=2023191 RepID=A0A2M9ZLN8_9LEPT|nr:flagellar motor protein MotB [Leptospira perolatii]PJZ69828.1 endoflagellar motor protein [Leptospira perolatii]PJZ72957.1 endoflagellar motor protein [Leptospira perolatii]
MKTRIISLISILFFALISQFCVSQSKYDELQTAYDKKARDLELLESDKAGLLRSMDEMKKMHEEAQKRVEEYKTLLASFKSMIDAGKLKIRIVDGRMVVVLSSDILFPLGSASLSPKGVDAIKEVTGILASLQGRRFQVEGHTDDIPTGMKGYTNWELASARALNVLHTMVKTGMPEERISAASMGSSRPAVPNNSQENRAANRRIEIVIVPDLANLPGLEELKKYSE